MDGGPKGGHDDWVALVVGRGLRMNGHFAPHLAIAIEEFRNLCCGRDTLCRQNRNCSPHSCCSSVYAGATVTRRNTSQPSRTSNEAKSRRRRIFRSALLSQPGIMASAASDSDRIPAASSDWCEPRASRDETRLGSLDCSCLSAPRRAKYFFSGSR